MLSRNLPIRGPGPPAGSRTGIWGPSRDSLRSVPAGSVIAIGRPPLGGGHSLDSLDEEATMVRRWALPILCAATLVATALGAAPANAATTPTAVGTGGAAATVDVRATDAAIATLKRGGNAVDAAVAAAAVLGVTEPFSCGIGGGGFMVLHRAADGTTTTI